MDYPEAGLVEHDVVSIPGQALGAPHPMRVRVGEVYVVPNYPLLALAGEDLATGLRLTVWVDPSLVHVVSPEWSHEPHPLPVAS
jgi:hypothetical protein